MGYTDAVLERFRRLAHAAQPEDVPEAQGEAGERARGSCVQILVWQVPGERDGALARVRFRALGCPALLVAADLACERLEGCVPAALAAIEPQALHAELGLPVEKLGQVLLVEDAARRCFEAVRAGQDN
ncbi:MAG: iron-sulfur cluster assembly scaffold protein [Gammaproteobacteria bacterium]|nr:iron-sulfur cluster assembly scaffold protein [Gammaproteobacteria bacterium]